MVDHEGRNALWYARSSGSQECVELLRNQGCPENPTLPRRRTAAQNPGIPTISTIPGGGEQQPGGAGGQGSEAFEKLPASVI